MKLPSVIVVVCVVLFSSMAFGTSYDTSYEESPLHYAAYRGDLSAVKALVKGGADVNEIGKESGKTPLHWAVNSGRLEYIGVVRFLVQNGADVNIKNKYGNTVLHQAAGQGKMAVAEIFIRQGRANVNVKNRRQATPLHVVKNAKTAKLLISSGADVHARNKRGETPLHRARGAEITRLLIEAGAKINARNSDGATPLHYVDDVPSAKLLVSAGADVHARTKGVTALKIKFGIERYLFSRDEKEKETGRYLGKMPLHYRIYDPELAKYFIGLGVDVNVKDNNGATPLHYASYWKYPKPMKLLVQAGADVNAKDKNGLTPLHLASNRGHLEIMEFLMESGADVHATDNEGRVPLHVMVYEKRRKMSHLLINKGINPRGKSKEFMRDFMDKNMRSVVKRVFGLFEQKGLDMNVRDNMGRSPLHQMMRGFTNLWLARIFMQQDKVDVNVKDNEGRTSLHDFIIYGGFLSYPNLIQVFISAGTDFNARDNEGKTPLHYVGRMKIRRTENIAKTLVNAGAKRNIKDNSGNIPMDYASTDEMRKILKP